MSDKELISLITRKKEFSQLPKKDVEIVFKKFENKDLNDYQKMKLTRQLLRKIYSGFSSRKVFSSKGKSAEWYLMKHKSSKERFNHYSKIYDLIFNEYKNKNLSVIDLGAGINGLSFLEYNRPKKIRYVGVEAIGQFVDLMNDFFLKNKFNGKAIHESLFNLDKIKKIILNEKSKRVVFLFKVIDSLESISRDYSKDVLSEVIPISDKVVLSFATKSLGNRRKFAANRNWLLKFIKSNFRIVDDFEFEGERYISIKKNS